MTKSQILDDIIEYEDKLIAQFNETELVEKVSKYAMSKYGREGFDIAKIYYTKQSNEPAQEECDDCADKANIVIEATKIANGYSNHFVSNREFYNNDDLKQLQNFIDNIFAKKYTKQQIQWLLLHQSIQQQNN